MPLLNNKRVPLIAPPPYDARRKRKEVWYLRFTNEIFTDYESYVNRLLMYRQPIWTCEATGRSNLTYEQALESEGRDEHNRAEFRFCETLRKRMLHRIQFQTIRLEPLVEDIFSYFRFNFAPGEVVHCELGEHVYLAKILDVYPSDHPGIFPMIHHQQQQQHPRPFDKHDQPPHTTTTTSSSEETESETDEIPRQPNGRLRFPDAFLHPAPVSSSSASSSPPPPNVVPQQHPSSYDMNGHANVPSTTLPSHPMNDRHVPFTIPLRFRVQLINEYEMPIENCARIVQIQEIRRDRRVFCRHLLQRFVRECAQKDSYIGAPWLVKPVVAQHYGIDMTLPAHLQEARDLAYAHLIRKRKVIEEDTIEKRARQDEGPFRRMHIKEERFKEQKRKPIPVKYPIEDLDLPIYRKDPNLNWELVDMSPDVYNGPETIPYPSGGRAARPIPHENTAIADDLFETFISVWSFLNVFSDPLELTPFSIDDFEQVLCQSPQQHTKTSILVDSNIALLNAIISERNQDSVSDIVSGITMEDYVDMLDEQNESGRSSSSSSSSSPQVKDTAFSRLRRGKVERGWRDAEQLKLGKNWDKKEIGSNRKGWETALIGCLNDTATPQLIPDLDLILRHLVPRNNSTAAERERQYPTLSIKHKLAILSFLMEAVNETSIIKDYMEQCQEQLTEFRRQRVELNKESKSLTARRIELDRRDRADKEEKEEDSSEDEESGSESEGDSDTNNDSSEDSAQSDDSDSATRRRHGRRHRSRQEKLRQKQQKRKEQEEMRQRQLQKQREAAKARSQELRQKAEERRKLEEEERALRKKEEQLEKDMRKYSTLRIRPLGRDRFYNRYLYMDNIGTSSTYGTGRLYVQSPSDVDIQMIMERDRKEHLTEQPWGRGGGRWFVVELMKAHGLENESSWLEERMDNTEGCSTSWWRYYSEPEEIQQLLAWLNPKGTRECKLKNEITKRQNYIIESMKSRMQALNKAQQTPSPVQTTPKRSSRTRSSAS